jgi:hypothetical protein
MSDQNRYDVFLRNDGNTALDYSVTGHDYTGKLAFTGEKEDASLPPGREETVALGIGLKRRPILGALYYIPFEVHITAGVAPPQVKTGLYEVRPLIPAWLLALLPLLFLCLLLIFMIGPDDNGNQTATPTVTATKELVVSPSPTATGPASPTASATPSPTSTGSASPTPTPSVTSSPTMTPTGTTTSTPSPTQPVATATPTPSATSTQTVTPVVVTPHYGPLSFSVTVTWRLDPSNPSWAIATVVITATGGDGNYTYYRDDILQIGPRFQYYWRACQINPVTFRVDSGDGQSARIELPEHAPCP